MGRKKTSISQTASMKANQSQSLGIVNKSKLKLKSSKPQNSIPLPKDWRNNDILIKIFDQMGFKDAVNANSVCRRWHQLITPKIHRSLKLLRYRYIQNGYHSGEKNPKILRNMEVISCIENNAKHSELVKHIKLTIIINATTSKHLFSTFCHLSQLEFNNLPMSQDLILTCLRPLQNLTSLTFDSVQVTKLVRKKFEFEIVKLPTTLTTLKMIKLRSYRLPDLFKESMMTHTNLEEFVYERNNEIDLLSPFLNNYPTLKRLTLKHKYAEELNDKGKEIIKSNPQLIKLTYNSDTIDSNLIKLINTNLYNLQTLNYRDFNNFQPDTLIHIQFPNRINLTSLTLHSNQFSTESYVSALNQTPNLTKLNITIDNNNSKIITSIIHQKFSNLEHLTYFKPKQTPNDSDKELETSFITDEMNHKEYTCGKRLKSLNFGNFNILTLDPSYLERFPNLEAIQFIHPVDYSQRSEIKQLLEDHLKTFVSWKFEFILKYPDFEGYLYKSNQAKPKDSIDNPFIHY